MNHVIDVLFRIKIKSIHFGDTNNIVNLDTEKSSLKVMSNTDIIFKYYIKGRYFDLDFDARDKTITMLTDEDIELTIPPNNISQTSFNHRQHIDNEDLCFSTGHVKIYELNFIGTPYNSLNELRCWKKEGTTFFVSNNNINSQTINSKPTGWKFELKNQLNLNGFDFEFELGYLSEKLFIKSSSLKYNNTLGYINSYLNIKTTCTDSNIIEEYAYIYIALLRIITGSNFKIIGNMAFKSDKFKGKIFPQHGSMMNGFYNIFRSNNNQNIEPLINSALPTCINDIFIYKKIGIISEQWCISHTNNILELQILATTSSMEGLLRYIAGNYCTSEYTLTIIASNLYDLKFKPPKKDKVLFKDFKQSVDQFFLSKNFAKFRIWNNSEEIIWLYRHTVAHQGLLNPPGQQSKGSNYHNILIPLKRMFQMYIMTWIGLVDFNYNEAGTFIQKPPDI